MSKISIKNLDLYYGDFKALKNINLEIEENKITAFIGPSGCGKSTLLKSINRMNDLVEGCRIEGEIALDGQNIFKGMDVNLLRKRVGMVFQNRNTERTSIRQASTVFMIWAIMILIITVFPQWLQRAKEL